MLPTEGFLLEHVNAKAVTGPVDLNDAANTGVRVDMQKCKRVTFLVFAAAGTTPSSHTFSFQQHNVSSAGTPANLEIDNPYFHKLGTADVWTKVQPGSKSASYDLDTLVGDAKFALAFEVLQEDLTDGYRWVSLNITDAGGAQLGAVVAIMHGMTEKPAYAKTTI